LVAVLPAASEAGENVAVYPVSRPESENVTAAGRVVPLDGPMEKV